MIEHLETWDGEVGIEVADTGNDWRGRAMSSGTQVVRVEVFSDYT
jgi:hypothetical protein